MGEGSGGGVGRGVGRVVGRGVGRGVGRVAKRFALGDFQQKCHLKAVMPVAFSFEDFAAGQEKI